VRRLRLRRSDRRSWRAVPALLAVLALLLRAVLPATADDGRAATARFVVALGGAICHAGGDAPALPDHGHDCDFCPACLGLTAAVVPAPPISAPLPRWRVAQYRLPAADAGPATPRDAATPPRGPPTAA
jgi:hypothetical protein